jgi:hypothetical protein
MPTRSAPFEANYTGLYVDPTLQEGFRQVIPSGLPLAAPFDQSFLEFLPTFFSDPTRFTWAHLWFVAYLLTFTLLYLPLFGRIPFALPRFLCGMKGGERPASPQLHRLGPYRTSQVNASSTCSASARSGLRTRPP